MNANGEYIGVWRFETPNFQFTMPFVFSLVSFLALLHALLIAFVVGWLFYYYNFYITHFLHNNTNNQSLS